MKMMGKSKPWITRFEKIDSQHINTELF
jgi:hypothetical protein